MGIAIDKFKVEKYSSYKNSGAEWLGDIPLHWNTLSNKNIFKLKKNQVGKKSSDYVLLSLTLNGVIKRDMENPQGKFPAEFNTYQEVKKGDFIFCLFDVEETPRCVGLSDFDGMITGAYTVMEPYENFDRNFLYYFYLNVDADKRLKPLYTGLRNTISKENFFSFKTFVPPLPEQTAIASFLDRKTALIDQAIDIKQKQIELLKERRQILIHKAVTRGLNPNVKMKDSGVEWIGEIPEGWEVKRLKHLGNSIIGLTYNPNDLCGMEEGTLVLRSSNLFEGKFKYGEKENAYVKSRIPKKLLIRENDILICSRNGSRDLIGKCALATKVDAGHSFGAFTTVFRSDINPYIFCILNSSIFKALSGMFLTSTINQLTIGNLNSIEVPIPPINEMNEVRNYVENINLKVDTAISLKEQEIEKLKEYKATLINSAVTGKIKVYNDAK